MVCLATRSPVVVAGHAPTSAFMLSAAVNCVLIVEGSCQKPSSCTVLELKKLGKAKPERKMLIVSDVAVWWRSLAELSEFCTFFFSVSGVGHFEDSR